jgi:hypothetical protein
MLDLKVPRLSSKDIIIKLDKETKNVFNMFLKEYDDDSLIFKISLTNSENYVSFLRRKFGTDKKKKIFLDDDENTIVGYDNKKGYSYYEYYIDAINDMTTRFKSNRFWIIELTSRELMCLQKKCFGEIICDSTAESTKLDNHFDIKNIKCFAFHVPGILMLSLNTGTKENFFRSASVKKDLPYSLFSQ